MELFWINLVTDIFPSIGLALEPPAPDVLEQPPRSREEPLIDAAYYRQLAKEATVIGGTSLAAHFYAINRHGTGPRTRSVTFFSLVAAQLLHAATCRRDRFQESSTPAMSNNPGLVAALAGSAALQALPMFLPPLRRLLGIGPVDPLDLAVVATTSATSYLLNEHLNREEPAPEPVPVNANPSAIEVNEHA
jgi:Ca2+-transporting ATPase